jgi:hypothetical protein
MEAFIVVAVLAGGFLAGRSLKGRSYTFAQFLADIGLACLLIIAAFLVAWVAGGSR